MQAPPITDELMKYLMTIFPDVAPDEHETERKLMFRGGQVSVVRHLAAQKQKQEQNILKA